jgi:ABC-type multidrug transport system fused ATPase/permease subunit
MGMYFHSSREEPERTADPEKRRANLRRIGPLFKPYRQRLSGLLLLIVVSAALGVVPAFLLKRVLEAIGKNDMTLAGAGLREGGQAPRRTIHWPGSPASLASRRPMRAARGRVWNSLCDWKMAVGIKNADSRVHNRRLRSPPAVVASRESTREPSAARDTAGRETRLPHPGAVCRESGPAAFPDISGSAASGRRRRRQP